MYTNLYQNSNLGQWETVAQIIPGIVNLFGKAPTAKPKRFAAGFVFKTGVTPTYNDMLNALQVVISSSKEGAYSLGNMGAMKGLKGVLGLGSGGYKGHSRDTMNLVNPTQNSARAIVTQIKARLNQLSITQKNRILSKLAPISPGEMSLTFAAKYFLPGFTAYLMASGQNAIQDMLGQVGNMFATEISSLPSVQIEVTAPGLPGQPPITPVYIPPPQPAPVYIPPGMQQPIPLPTFPGPTPPSYPSYPVYTPVPPVTKAGILTGTFLEDVDTNTLLIGGLVLGAVLLLGRN